jgi:uncharacterized protein (DUF58 family)
MQMQSKIYEATTTYTMVIFLNILSQFDSSHGLQPEVQELGICAAASVADWAINEGYAVGLYANTLMYMPEERVEYEAEQEGEGEQNLAATLAAQLKRRRIHLPPATSEEQRKRIMDVLARIQPFFGSTFEDVVHTERSRLPAGATVVIITSTVTGPLLETLARIKQSGHAVTILFAGDKPFPAHLAGVTVYHLGGKDTWKQLEAAYSKTSNDETRRSEQVAAVGFRL